MESSGVFGYTMKHLNEKEVIKRIAGLRLVENSRYPLPLSPTLAAWYCYTIDGGHSILCFLRADWRNGRNTEEYLTPVPVKTILRQGFDIENEFIIVNLDFGKNSKLSIFETDEEF